MTEQERADAYQVAPVVLEAIARRALEGDKRVRLHTGSFGRSKGVEVTMEGRVCRATLHLDGLLGEDLNQVGRDLQHKVARALSRMTGCTVGAVDIVFEGVFAPPVGE